MIVMLSNCDCVCPGKWKRWKLEGENFKAGVGHKLLCTSDFSGQLVFCSLSCCFLFLKPAHMAFYFFFLRPFKDRIQDKMAWNNTHTVKSAWRLDQQKVIDWYSAASQTWKCTIISIWCPCHQDYRLDKTSNLKCNLEFYEGAQVPQKWK